MELRVLVGLCVLAFLVVPLPAQVVPTEATNRGDHIDYQEVCVAVAEKTADAVSVHAIQPTVEKLEYNVEELECPVERGEVAIVRDSATALQALPRVVVLEGNTNVYLVREIEARVTVRENVTEREAIRYTLDPGERRFFAVPVREGASHHWVDIRWNASAGDLALLICPPDGCLGPYTDADDGVIDGRIFLDISSAEGLAPGDWYYELRHSGGEGPVAFSFETYT